MAGKILPITCNTLGSIATGNIIPDNMIDGKKTSCVRHSHFRLALLKNTPKTIPILKLTMINKITPNKYIKIFSGICALKIIGALIKIIKLNHK